MTQAAANKPDTTNAHQYIFGRPSSNGLAKITRSSSLMPPSLLTTCHGHEPMRRTGSPRFLSGSATTAGDCGAGGGTMGRTGWTGWTGRAGWAGRTRRRGGGEGGATGAEEA